MKIHGKSIIHSLFSIAPRRRGGNAEPPKNRTGHNSNHAEHAPSGHVISENAKKRTLQHMFFSKIVGTGRPERDHHLAAPVENNRSLHLAYPLVGLQLLLFAGNFDILDLNEAPPVCSDPQAMKIEALAAGLEPLGSQHIDKVPVTQRLVLEAKLTALKRKVNDYHAAMVRANARNGEIVDTALQNRMTESLKSIEAKLTAMLQPLDQRKINAELMTHLEKQVIENVRTRVVEYLAQAGPASDRKPTTVISVKKLRELQHPYLAEAESALNKAFAAAGYEAFPGSRHQLKEKINRAEWSIMAPKNLRWENGHPFLIKPDVVMGNTSIVNEHIAKGSYGSVSVMRCEDGTELICKRAIGNSESDLDEAVRQFEHEASMYEHVINEAGPHPNLVNVYGIAQQTINGKRESMLIMDKITGPDGTFAFNALRKHWHSGSISSAQYWGTIQFIARRLFDACQHLAKAAIAHNDIKPNNFMVDRTTGEPILFDLGLAQHGGLESIAGTPGFVPPQRKQTEIPASEKTDVWSTIATVAFGVNGGHKYGRNSLPSLTQEELQEKVTSYAEFERKMFAKIDEDFVDSEKAKTHAFLDDRMIDDSEAREVLKNVLASDGALQNIPRRPIARRTRSTSLQKLHRESGAWKEVIDHAASEIQAQLPGKLGMVISGVSQTGSPLDRATSKDASAPDPQVMRAWAEHTNQRVALARRIRERITDRVDVESLRRFVNDAQRKLKSPSILMLRFNAKIRADLADRTAAARIVLDLLDATADLHPTGAGKQARGRLSEEQMGIAQMLQQRLTERYPLTESNGTKVLYASSLRRRAGKEPISTEAITQPVGQQGDDNHKSRPALMPGRMPKMPRFLEQSMRKHAATEEKTQRNETKKKGAGVQPKPYRKA